MKNNSEGGAIVTCQLKNGAVRRVTEQLIYTKKRSAAAIAIVATIVIATGLAEFGCGRQSENPTGSRPSSNAPQTAKPTVELSEEQLRSIKIEPVGTYRFSVEKKGIGSIDFNNNVYFDNNLSVQVFPPSPGKIVKTFVELGDEVQKGDPLYAIARGESETERVTSRQVGNDLVVRSPITGQITSVNVTPGLLVQPGKAPAPCAVADVSIKWMLANVTETDSPVFRVGQPVEVRVAAYPGRVFEGKVTKIYPNVDPNSHRVTVRSEIVDPKNELRAGMIANFVARVQEPLEGTAIPASGVVRESDGTLTAWVTTDRHRFIQRTVKIGLQQAGRYQVLEGLQRGELAVIDGAVFLSNMLQAPPTD
jgi:multidrug efflux pump subunit AcrA (membrane-fusion protein)